MNEERENKETIDSYTRIWCSKKDGIYTPLSLDSLYTPKPELIKELSEIGFEVVRCFARIACEIQTEVEKTNYEDAIRFPM